MMNTSWLMIDPSYSRVMCACLCIARWVSCIWDFGTLNESSHTRTGLAFLESFSETLSLMFTNTGILSFKVEKLVVYEDRIASGLITWSICFIGLGKQMNINGFLISMLNKNPTGICFVIVSHTVLVFTWTVFSNGQVLDLPTGTGLTAYLCCFEF